MELKSLEDLLFALCLFVCCQICGSRGRLHDGAGVRPHLLEGVFEAGNSQTQAGETSASQARCGHAQ